MVLSGGCVAVVGSWLPGEAGMALLLWPDDPGRDGSVGLAARRPTMTRPLIERRDVIAG